MIWRDSQTSCLCSKYTFCGKHNGGDLSDDMNTTMNCFWELSALSLKYCAAIYLTDMFVPREKQNKDVEFKQHTDEL